MACASLWLILCRCCHWQFRGQPSPGAAIVTRREDVPGCPLCDECSLHVAQLQCVSRSTLEAELVSIHPSSRLDFRPQLSPTERNQ